MTELPRPAIVPPLGMFPALDASRLAPLPALTVTPRRVYAEPINVDELAMLDAVTTSALVREVEAKLLAEDARLRRLLPPPLPGFEWRAEISSLTEHDVDAFTMHETIRLRYRLVEVG